MIIISDYSDKGVDKVMKVMKVREVILKAIGGFYTWLQAADI